MFGFVRIVPKDGGLVPDLPEGASFAVLVNSRDGKWAICDWDANEDEEEGVPSSGHRIEFGERLRTMVYSAEKYPPSLVLGLRAVMDRFPEDPTRESARLIFEEQLAASIYTLLNGHPPFFSPRRLEATQSTLPKASFIGS